jgi:hypothetical protein
MNRALGVIVTAVAPLISQSTFAHADLIVNGSFEDPNENNGLDNIVPAVRWATDGGVPDRSVPQPATLLLLGAGLAGLAGVRSRRALR